MKYTIIAPCQALKSFVSHFWVGTWDMLLQKPNNIHYVVASSLTEITFGFNGSDKQADLLFSSVQGHTNLPNQYVVDGFHHLIGVSFYSYAIPSLFNIHSLELNKTFMPLTMLLGNGGKLLNEKIALATTTQQRIKILSNYFISILKNRKLEDELITMAIKEMKKYNGNIKVEELADYCCLSQKQFGRRFKEFSGFNPKIYSRIVRFESVVNNYSKITNLTEVAYNQGYFDQAHFNHDFKFFTGFSPKDFWKIGEDKK